MDTGTAISIAILALGLGSFVVGMLPACVPEHMRRRYPLTMSCLLCFGAGVLLATSLIHMLPETREKLPNYSELFLCLGFFVVYLVDEIVHLFYGSKTIHEPNRPNYTEQTSLLRGREEVRQDGELDTRDRCCGDTENPRMCHVSHTAPCSKSSSGFIGLLCALFVHSLLEGLAIGLQDTASKVLLLLGAVMSHKYVVGFCLGAELCGADRSLCSHIICVGLFAGGSVAGIALGSSLEGVPTLADTIAVPIFQALAAGTLLYVTVSEVLPRERARFHERQRGSGAAQFVAVVVGFGVMYFSTKYLDQD